MKWALSVVVGIATCFGCTRASRDHKPGVEVLGTTDAIAPHAVFDPVTGIERVAGKVVDESGAPIAGVTVRAMVHGAATATSTTAADGSFSLDKLAKRAYVLTASKDDLYGVHVEVTPGLDRDPVTVRMQHGCTVAVHVSDADTRAPIANARVEISPLVVQTASDGVASVRGVRPDRVAFLAVHADGHAPAARALELQDAQGTTVDQTIELSRGAEVRGIVRGPGGQPVEGATVSYMVDLARAREDDVTTGADGTWRYPVMRAGTYVFFASGGGYAQGETAPVAIDGKTPRSDLFITLPLGAQLAGEVRDANGTAVPGAEVIVHTHRAPGASAITDAHGRFEIFGLPPGKASIYATRGDDASPMGEITFEANRRTSVRIGIGPSVIEGTAVDDAGKPVADARISLQGDSHSESFAGRSFTAFSIIHSAVSDSAGHFRFRGIPSGSYELAARRGKADPLADHNAKRTTVTTGTRDLTLHVAPAATITGRVVLDGHPVTDFAIVTASPSIPDPTRVPRPFHSADGSFAITDLGDGKWGLTITGADFARTIVNVDAVGGKAVALGDVVVDRGIDVHGRVTDSRGPVAGATVTIDGVLADRADKIGGQPPRHDYMTTTAADGTYTIPHVAPVIPKLPLHIVARVPGREISQPRQLAATESTVDLALVAPGAVDGVVESRKKDLVVVFASRDGTPVASTLLDMNGEFHFPELAPGDYKIQLMTSGLAADAEVAVQVTSGGHAQARFH